MVNPLFRKGSKVRVKFFHKEFSNCYGRVFRVLDTGRVGVFIDGVEGWVPFHPNELVVIDRGSDTPIDTAAKRMKQKTVVCFVSGENSNYEIITRKALLDMINNSYTKRITIQHMNGVLYHVLDREEFDIARKALTHKSSYLWILVGWE